MKGLLKVSFRAAVHHFIGKTVAQKMRTFAGIALAYACGMIYL